MKSLGKCVYCIETVSEIGAFVKLSAGKHAHMNCYYEAVFKDAFERGRKAVLDEITQKQVDKVKFEETQAKLAYENARRCEKCGVAMLAERPAALPSVYATVLPASSDARQCSDCVRAEVGARAVARRPAAPASAAEAIRTAPTRLAEVPKGISEEDKKVLDRARETGIAIDLD